MGHQVKEFYMVLALVDPGMVHLCTTAALPYIVQ